MIDKRDITTASYGVPFSEDRYIELEKENAQLKQDFESIDGTLSMANNRNAAYEKHFDLACQVIDALYQHIDDQHTQKDYDAVVIFATIEKLNKKIEKLTSRPV